MWKQPRSPEPMEPECNKPMNHCSQLVKGMTTVANWLRVVTLFPLGTQSGPLRPPYGSLTAPSWFPYGSHMIPLWLPFGSLTPPLWLRKRRPANGRLSLIFIGFKLIFVDFH